MNRAKFYDSLRNDPVVFPGNRISNSQFEGMQKLLDVVEEYLPLYPYDKLAYDLGTAYHETGHTMQPIKERGAKSYFNKYEPGTKLGKVLGNTEPGDGYRFRGEGHVQNTGRANAKKSSDELNKRFKLKTDFVRFPEQRGNPVYSALCLFLGNDEGWWTGKKLGDFLDGIDEGDAEDFREYVNARRVVNGVDKAEVIAQFAVSFERALKAAGYLDAPKLQPKPIPQGPVEASNDNWLTSLVKRIFGK